MDGNRRCMMLSMVSPAHGPQSKQLLEAQLRVTLDVIPAYTWYADPTGALRFVNERTADYLGLAKDHPLRFGIDVGGQWDSHVPFLHQDDQEETRRVWSTCLRTGSAGELTFRVRGAVGEYRWFLSRAEPLRAGDGTLLFWIGVNLDIEERKQAEFYLAEAQRLAHMGSWTFKGAAFDYWSSELFQIHGLDPSGKPPTAEEYLDLVHPEDRGFMKQAIAMMFTDHHGFDFTKRIARPDGEIRYIRCVGVPVTHGEPFQGFVGTGMDVTEQEQATQERQRREAYLAEAQRLSHTGSFGWKPRTGEIVWSEQTYRIFEYEHNKKPTLDMVLNRVHPDDRALALQVIEQATNTGADFKLECRLLMPSGGIKQLHVRAHSQINSSGNIEFIGAVTDVTERKTVEEKIREQEAELRQTLDFAPQLIAVYGPNRERLHANRGALDYLGFSLEEWCQGPDRGVILHPDDRERVREYTDRALSSGAAYEQEFRLRNKDGSYRWFLARYNPVRDDKGQIRRWYVACTDIEDRKQAEDRVRDENVALKRAEEKIRAQELELRQMLDFTPQYLGVLGADGTPIYANRASLDYLGMNLDEWRQRKQIGEEVHPDDLERVTSELDRALSTGSAVEIELRVRKSDGCFRWFLSRYNPVRDENGQMTRLYLASTDIHDRKIAEERLQQENVALREEIDKASMFEEIIGTSPALKTVLSRISKVAPSDSTVLITGETGTGKELVARAIHRRSPRGQRPFVSVNCAAIPRDLIASELFGHERGAFTGATQQRLGRFELANGGTIFLDEVGELPVETQIALLRVLQEHEFERVGGSRRIRADVRVIAATNRDLQAAISAGSFRSDLFYRLNVFPIEIPSLRERREDIPLLVEYFIDRYARKAGKDIRGVNKKTLQLLQSYPWPGNIRELQNVIERSVILCETEIFSIDENWLPQSPPLLEPKHYVELPTKLLAQEKNMIEAALKETRGRVSGPTGAAAMLGTPRSTLESKIRSLKINKNRFKT
jgi:PAS domain S-box-containing protein